MPTCSCIILDGFCSSGGDGGHKAENTVLWGLTKPTSDPWSSRINSQGFSGACVCFSRPRLRAGEGWRPRLLGGTSGGQLSSPGGACWLSECGLGLPRAPFGFCPGVSSAVPQLVAGCAGWTALRRQARGPRAGSSDQRPAPCALSLQRLLGFEGLCAGKGVQAEQTSEVTSVPSPVKRGRGSC